MAADLCVGATSTPVRNTKRKTIPVVCVKLKLGNLTNGRETRTLINTCEVLSLHERDLPSSPFGIQGHRNASGVQESLSHGPCMIGQSP